MEETRCGGSDEMLFACLDSGESVVGGMKSMWMSSLMKGQLCQGMEND